MLNGLPWTWRESTKQKCADLFASVHWCMLSPAGKDRIKSDIAMLEKARNDCADSGLRKVIENWIEDAKKTLADASKKDSLRVRC